MFKKLQKLLVLLFLFCTTLNWISLILINFSSFHLNIHFALFTMMIFIIFRFIWVRKIKLKDTMEQMFLIIGLWNLFIIFTIIRNIVCRISSLSADTIRKFEFSVKDDLKIFKCWNTGQIVIQDYNEQ